MNPAIIKIFFLKFLMLPLLALTLVVALVFVKKKNELIKNKTLIFYILITSITIAIPALLGFTGNTFSPYGYLFSQCFYLIAGSINAHLLQKYFKNEGKSRGFVILFESIVTLICLAFGGYLYYTIFDFISSYPGYGAMAATCIIIFALPLIFYYCYIQFISIPLDIYKTWQHNKEEKAINFDGMDYNKLMVMSIEIAKNLHGHQFKINAKAPDNVLLGNWFHRFLEDYNTQNSGAIIELENGLKQPYSWIFYSKKSFFHSRRYLDFEKTIAQNRLSDKDIIRCKRVSELAEPDTTQPQQNKQTSPDVMNESTVGLS